MNLLDSHDTNRAVIKLDHDGITGTGANRTPVNGFADGKARLKTVAILQYTLPGAPTIYYGDEVGLAGFGSDVPRDDPYNRQPYPWADEAGYDASARLAPGRREPAGALPGYGPDSRRSTASCAPAASTPCWPTTRTNAWPMAARTATAWPWWSINRAKTAQTIDLQGRRLPAGRPDLHRRAERRHGYTVTGRHAHRAAQRAVGRGARARGRGRRARLHRRTSRPMKARARSR